MRRLLLTAGVPPAAGDRHPFHDPRRFSSNRQPAVRGKIDNLSHLKKTPESISVAHNTECGSRGFRNVEKMQEFGRD
jgi:hypothetical protein